MTRNQVESIFTIAGVSVLRIWEMPNQYWPRVGFEEGREHDFIRYHVRREASPWWLVKTAAGMIEIGWRKRVISIDWSDTGVHANVTSDPVTKGFLMVHADSELKAAEYLAALKPALQMKGAAQSAAQSAAQLAGC